MADEKRNMEAAERKKSCNSISAIVNSRQKLTPKDNAQTYAIEVKQFKAKELEDCEYDPYQNVNVEHPTENWETLIHLLKGSIGTGIFAMPMAFKHSGYALGLVATAVIGLICLYCVHQLLRAEYTLSKRRKIPNLSYPEVAVAALQDGPPILQKLAPYSRHIVNAFTLTFQLGSCSVYTVFIAENIKYVVDKYVDEVDGRVIMTIFLLPLILINYIKNLKYLAPLTTIANCLTFVSFGIIIYYLIEANLTTVDRVAVNDYTDYPLFFGTVLFALEAIGVIMPIKNEMKHPAKFGTACGVLNIGMSIILSMYIGVGFMGYLAYGEDVKGSISYNIDQDAIPSQVCKVMLSLAIYITHALQMYVGIEIVWDIYLLPKFEKNKNKNFWEYAVRTFLVVFTYCLAVAIPYIDLFISLVGALCLSALGIAIPAVIETSTYWYDLKGTGTKRVLVITKNVALFIFAIFGLIVGTYTSLVNIGEKLFGDNTDEHGTTAATLMIISSTPLSNIFNISST